MLPHTQQQGGQSGEGAAMSCTACFLFTRTRSARGQGPGPLDPAIRTEGGAWHAKPGQNCFPAPPYLAAGSGELS